MMERYQRMDPEHFNDVLDGIADALAMTDAEISQGSGISRQTINGMRGGRAKIRPDKLWPLASALGADVEVFFLPDVAEAVREALRGRHYNRAERRFGPPDALESPGGRQGELSKRSDRQRCTAPTLTLLTYRSILMGERTGLAA